jgi:hypothetical protein
VYMYMALSIVALAMKRLIPSGGSYVGCVGCLMVGGSFFLRNIGDM